MFIHLFFLDPTRPPSRGGDGAVYVLDINQRNQDKAGKGRGGKTTSGNGQAWSSASPRGQWRTGKNGDNWLQNYLWCPNDPRG